MGKVCLGVRRNPLLAITKKKSENIHLPEVSTVRQRKKEWKCVVYRIPFCISKGPFAYVPGSEAGEHSHPGPAQDSAALKLYCINYLSHIWHGSIFFLSLLFWLCYFEASFAIQNHCESLPNLWLKFPRKRVKACEAWMNDLLQSAFASRCVNSVDVLRSLHTPSRATVQRFGHNFYRSAQVTQGYSGPFPRMPISGSTDGRSKA